MRKWIRMILILVAVMSIVLAVCGSQKKAMDPAEILVQYQGALTTAVVADEAHFRSIAQAIQNCPEKENAYYYFQTNKTNFPVDIQQSVASLPINYGLNLSSIYTGGQTAEVYPDGACVFRCTVMSGNSVYCWVDLIYSEDWESLLHESGYKEMQARDVLTCVAPNWCIVRLYGF